MNTDENRLSVFIRVIRGFFLTLPTLFDNLSHFVERIEFVRTS